MPSGHEGLPLLKGMGTGALSIICQREERCRGAGAGGNVCQERQGSSQKAPGTERAWGETPPHCYLGSSPHRPSPTRYYHPCHKL